jgi:hypothetical protein
MNILFNFYNSHLQDDRIKNVFMYILTGGVNPPSGPQEPPQPPQPPQPSQPPQPEEVCYNENSSSLQEQMNCNLFLLA